MGTALQKREGDVFGLFDDMDRLFWNPFGRLASREVSTNWAPAIDIHEDKESVTIEAELAGLKKEDIKINVEDDVLTLQGERKYEDERKDKSCHRIERRYGMFARSFTLPHSVDASKVKATMKDGLLQITLPKREESKPKTVPIEIH